MNRVFDIKRNIELHHSDRFFVDTNVWFWFTYAASNEINPVNYPVRYQIEKYPLFIEKILDKGAKLYHSPLVLSELTNIIEKTEYNSYKNSHRLHNLTRKDFRDIEEKRKKVMLEVSNSWAQITSMSEALELTINSDLADFALKTLNAHSLDAYDAFYIRSMSEYQISKIITDDRDFQSLDLELYTANNMLIS
ncbi:type II toxin-antitoxin system VapC family toxin [Gallaecimonas pentaromativorans]|uniref:Putative nucleic acid-binding protein n=1 Tax=Gallaecimonas pentaromativorans TaxID=584787 RepID=A0A3N1P708_9GAMM|nr:PIN domain-containing protein [Gallaecimonas pentaromativorans]ROQ24335.1 putative nucleic acid-binding protein [Gallaecimonas pentaromativorans]